MSKEKTTSPISNKRLQEICETQLKDLKPFQLASANHAYRHLIAKNGSKRFLVADEVGLGKTYVAKGVIALRILELLKQKQKDITILYICSNQSIAAQNIKTLNIFKNTKSDQVGKSVSTRLTLFAKQDKNARKEIKTNLKVQFFSFTSGTSFNLHSSTGIVEERLILLALCKKILSGKRKWKCLEDLLKCGVLDDNWDTLKDPDHLPAIRRDVIKQFANEVQNDSKFKKFEELYEEWRNLKKSPSFKRVILNNNKNSESANSPLSEWISKRNKWIGALRTKLAEVCLRQLKPDLIIMDEFQNFDHLLRKTPQNLDEGLLIDALLLQDDAPPLLLLSATPYQFDPGNTDISKDPAEAFFELLQKISLKSDVERNELKEQFETYRKHLIDLSQKHDKDVLEKITADTQNLKNDLEEKLMTMMVRTERGHLMKDSMKEDRISGQQDADYIVPKPSDLQHFLNTQRLFDTVGCGSALEYCKFASHLPFFMKNYVFNRELNNKIDNADERSKIEQAWPQNQDNLFERMLNYEEVDVHNPMIRQLAKEMEIGHQLLWIPPTIRYWKGVETGLNKVGEQFDKGFDENFTKRLIFSGWNVVPDCISGLLSYTVEREMLKSERKKGHYNSKKLYDRLRSKGLRLFVNPKTSLPENIDQFVLHYPCWFLANIDISPKSEVEDFVDIQNRVRRLIFEKVKSLSIEPNHLANMSLIVLLLLLDEDATVDAFRNEVWKDQMKALGDYEYSNEEGQENNKKGRSTKDLRKYIHEIFARYDAASVKTASKESEDHSRILFESCLDSLLNICFGAPATLALRSILQYPYPSKSVEKETTDVNRMSMAFELSKSFRSLFNQPANIALIHQVCKPLKSKVTKKMKQEYWSKILQYSIAGNLQSVLDELMVVNHGDIDEIAKQIRPNQSFVRISQPNFDTDGLKDSSSFSIRCGYAQRFAQSKSDDDKQTTTLENVQRGFNSPFRPFVLSSTSVGSEGLDFHSWCHSLIHWNLPGGPLSKEQKEGRIHRYMGHAIRRNLAEQFFKSKPSIERISQNIWSYIVQQANVSTENKSSQGLQPFWLSSSTNPKVKIQIASYHYQFGKEKRLSEQLSRQVTGYRLAFGHANPQGLLDYFATKEDSVIAQISVQALNLSPKMNETPQNNAK